MDHDELLKEVKELRHQVAELKEAEVRLRHTEAALLESEQKYRTLNDNLNVGVFRSSFEGVFLYANPTIARMAGYSSAKEFMTVPAQTLYADISDRERLIQDLKRNGSVTNVEMRSARKDGPLYWISLNAVVEQDPSGKPMGILGIVEDVTNRKRAEKELLQEKRRFETLAENAPFGMVMISQDGRFLYANPKFAELFGYGVEEIPVGREWFRRAYPDAEYRREVIAAWLEDIRTVTKGEQRPRVFSVRCKDGGDKVIHFRPVQLETGEHVMTCEDITERTEMENSLVSSERKYRELYENLRDGLAAVDQEGKIIEWNQRFQEMVGYPSDRIPQLTYGDITPEKWRSKEAQIIEEQVFAKGFSEVYEKEYIRSDGSVFPVELRTYLRLDDQGNYQGMWAYVRDITRRKTAERLVEEHVSMLESILEKAADGICVCHNIEEEPYICFTHWNPRMTEITGFSMEEINSLGWYQTMYPNPKVRALAMERMAKMREGDDILAEEWVVATKENSDKTLSISTSVLKEENGRIHVLALMQDISERKLAEQALKQSEEFNRRMVQHSPMGILYLTAEGVISFTNPACNRIFEVPDHKPSPLIGLNIFQLPLIAGQPHVRSHFEELVLEAKPQRDIELEYQSPLTGKDYTLLASATPRPAGDGTIIGSVVMITDITDRKRVEQQLQRLHAAVEQAAETIVVTDPAGTILYVNPAFEITTGYKREEALGQNPRILKSGLQDRAFYESMWQTLSRGQVWRGEFTNRRKDGSLFEEKATISPIKNDQGEIVSYVAVKREVTAEVALQKQLLQAQKMEAIGTLAGGIAHDFNNLLMVILGYADLLLQLKRPEDPDREKLKAMRQAARDGADLVNRILTFSKRVESKARPIDLNEEIRRIEQLVIRMIPKMIEIQLLLEANLRIINSDPAQIEQIILNLAVNAHHAMPEGGRLVIETSNVSLGRDYSSIRPDVQPGEYVLLSVSDTGAGIDPKIVDRIFEPFFTTKDGAQGTGLGLSMVHGIVAQHGGYIECYSELGAGTSFKIYFPAAAGQTTGDMAATAEMPAFGTETILLVDDDVRIRDLAAEMLMMGGYDVVPASNGQQALEIYRERKGEISLVILDLIMPGMSGNQCLKELLEIEPEVRVLISSGYSANGPTKQLSAAGARGFITKPYDMKDILRVIRRIIDADN